MYESRPSSVLIGRYFLCRAVEKGEEIVDLYNFHTLATVCLLIAPHNRPDFVVNSSPFSPSFLFITHSLAPTASQKQRQSFITRFLVRPPSPTPNLFFAPFRVLLHSRAPHPPPPWGDLLNVCANVFLPYLSPKVPTHFLHAQLRLLTNTTSRGGTYLRRDPSPSLQCPAGHCLSSSEIRP